MSLQFRISDQVLRVDDTIDATEAQVHKYDAFLNLLCEGRYAFQRDAVRTAWRFLVSPKYPELERLALENWNANPMIQGRYDSREFFLQKMPLRAKRSASLDLATGTGKSFVMYALAAIALAEGVVDRVLVLCPSLTIEEGLLEKFMRFAGDPELAAIMRECGAVYAIPGVRRGNETTQPGDICVENIHAIYETTGSAIRDSFRGKGERALVLNDEAHHLFSGDDRGLRKWMEFLLDPEFSFARIVNVTGTPYVGNDYFPDVIFRYGLKDAIAAKVVKKPNYKLQQTLEGSDWAESFRIHEKNRTEYGAQVKPLSIVVTADIPRCIEVWDELVRFLAQHEGIPQEAAERKVIWVTSGVPGSGDAKKRVEAILPTTQGNSAERLRKANLFALHDVDDLASPVEWIVSVAMLSEGWDVKNVFQIVPHESRAFNSKLLIAQVLGRGLRVPPGMDQPLVTINNHERWNDAIGRLLEEVLEVENTLSWGYDPNRAQYIFPLYNLRYEARLQTVETKRAKARMPELVFHPQARQSTQTSFFSETGALHVEIEHRDLYEVDDAVRLVRLFLRDKDPEIAKAWPAAKLKEWVTKALRAAGQDATFLSRRNLLHVQQAFGPMFREKDGQHPRYTQEAMELEAVDIKAVGRQSFSESTLKEHGSVWYVEEEPPQFGESSEAQLWVQYQKALQIAKIDASLLESSAREIAKRLHQVDLQKFKTPWNLHYASHAPEREFSRLLFANAEWFEAFVKMPDRGGYRFPYSYKPAKTGRTHTANEHFHPDYFIRVRGAYDILVVEIKADDDDSNRNRAKCRDGERHFFTLNECLAAIGEPWHYCFFFLSPEDYSAFFDQVRNGKYARWRSGLMQSLHPAIVE